MFRCATVFALLWFLSSADWIPYKKLLNEPHEQEDCALGREIVCPPDNRTDQYLSDMCMARRIEYGNASGKRRRALRAKMENAPIANVSTLFSAEFYQEDIPPSVDYRETNCVSAVKNQNGVGGCSGTCWAFATTGLLEYHYCAKGFGVVSLSEKYLVDCVGGESGCCGGFVTKAMRYIMHNSSTNMPLEEQYPYDTYWYPCRSHATGVDLSNLGTLDLMVSCGDYELLEAVAFNGPIIVNIWANSTEFQQYIARSEDEIFESKACEYATRTTHFVLVVGYGTNQNGDYWLIKNSWGTNWGWNGYMKLRRDKPNYCRLTDFIYIPQWS